MHDNAPLPRKKFWHQKLERSGFFLCAVLFHLILFLLIATIVVWKAPLPPEPAEFHGVEVKVPPPSVQPPPSGGAAHNPDLEPDVVVPVVTPPSVISVNHMDTFTVNAAKVMDQSLNHLMAPAPQGTGLDAAGGGPGIGSGNGFGKSTGTSAQLSGYLYDFKQTAQKTPIRMTEKSYLDLLSQYIKNGWNDSMFSPLL